MHRRAVLYVPNFIQPNDLGRHSFLSVQKQNDHGIIVVTTFKNAPVTSTGIRHWESFLGHQ